jgi:D-alanyl-D-alanine carboxypeptidase
MKMPCLIGQKIASAAQCRFLEVAIRQLWVGVDSMYGPRTNKVIVSYVFIIITIITLSFTGCSCDTKSLNKDTQEELNAVMEEVLAESGSPGCIVGVYTPDGNWVRAKGKADTEAGVPMKTTDLMRIGSITKSFTSTVVLQLADEGELKLDDKLSKYVPDFPNSDRITVYQLLSHTSGLMTWDEIESVRMGIKDNPGEWTIEKLIKVVGEQPLLSAPGSQYHYSNINYFLLGMIIEGVTNSKLEQQIKQRIIDPLGMKKTSLPDGPTVDGETVHGYYRDMGKLVDSSGTKYAEAINYSLAWSAGGMISTVEDLKVWAKALASGQLLIEAMHKVQMGTSSEMVGNPPVKLTNGMGMVQIDQWVGSNGAVAGYQCNMFYYPEKEATIITFFNKLNPYDLEENTAELTAYMANFKELSKILYPETFPGMK